MNRSIAEAERRYRSRLDPAVDDLYTRRRRLERQVRPIDELMSNFIKIPDGKGGWAGLRMKSYVDGDPLAAEAGHLLGTLSVGGVLYRVYYSAVRLREWAAGRRAEPGSQPLR